MPGDVICLYCAYNIITFQIIKHKMKTKKSYIQPRTRLLGMGTEQHLLAASASANSVSLTAALFDYGAANSISFN